MVIPTLLITHALKSKANQLPERILQKLMEVMTSHVNSIKCAYRRGVPIALGTDSICYGSQSIAPWGNHGEELRLMVELIGMFIVFFFVFRIFLIYLNFKG
jgi:imidazolonepropionase-like amidohydrolase